MQNSHSQSRLLKLIKNPLVHIVILLAMAFVVLLARGGSDQSLVSTKDGEDDEEDAKASLTLPTTKISSSKDFTLTIGDRAKVQPGLTLVPIAGSEQVILLSTEGQVVHSWDFDVARARLLPNCNLLVLHGSNWGKTKKPWKKMLNLIREYDWDGNVVWEFEAPMELHHDLARLENGNTLVLAKIAVEIPGEEDAEDPVAQHPRRLRTDRVLEVNPLGEVVWSWDAHKHLDTASCGWRDCGEKYEEHRVRDEFIDWTHANTVSPLPENHWFTAGDTRFR
ncbi:MAG: aryl-sulfate sulfotransferase, partial [Bdellovibrionales bacterium]|nr:aryl-sulfate sulfotransferase [Bdellovibrionales bacterium]